MDDERPEYQLLSSTRYDPHLKSYKWNDDQEGPIEFFLLPFHFERLVSAAQIHGWTNAESALGNSALKSACIKAVSMHSKGVCRTLMLNTRVLTRRSSNRVFVPQIPNVQNGKV